MLKMKFHNRPIPIYVCVMTNAFAMTSGKDSTPYSLFYSERVSEFGKLLVNANFYSLLIRENVSC